MGRAVSIDKLAEKKGYPRIPWHLPRCVEVDPYERVRKSMLPSSGRGVVIRVVHYIPPQDHITKSETAVRPRRRRTQEFARVQVLAPQNPVNITDRHFDFLRTRRRDTAHRRMNNRLSFLGGGHEGVGK